MNTTEDLITTGCPTIAQWAAAFQGKKGDLLTIMSFAQIGEGMIKRWSPRVIVLGKDNRIVSERGI